MASLEEIKATLRKYILLHFLPGESESNLKDETPLRTSGIIDSLGTIQLVSFIEDAFDVELEAHETGIEYFDRVEDLAALVASKLEG